MQVVVVNSATSKYKCQQSLENIGTLCHTYSSSWCKLMTYTSAQGTEYDMAWYATKQDYKKKKLKKPNTSVVQHIIQSALDKLSNWEEKGISSTCTLVKKGEKTKDRHDHPLTSSSETKYFGVMISNY